MDSGRIHNPGKDANSPPDGHLDELRLHRYLEGRLGESERGAVEQTLRSLPAARRMLDALREEEKLIRDALETRVEAGPRLSDKVIATLHAEERSRLQALRGRRLRRQFFGIASMAACLFLIFWLAKPREAAGTAISGSSATLLTPSGERRALGRNVRVYDGDQLSTAEGQFVRLQLAGAAALDIDEHSKLSIEKPRYERNDNAPVLNLEAGRIGIDAAGRQDVLVQVPQGSIRVFSGAHVDVWLPEPSGAKWPDPIEQAPANVSVAKNHAASATSTSATAAMRPALLTVFSGTAQVVNETDPSGATGVTVFAGYRSVFTSDSRSIRKIDMNGSVVLDTRSSPGWHTVETPAPGLNQVGLLESPDFIEMGRRLHMTENAPAVADALKQLQEAMQTVPALQRAEKLALSQQALRSAYEPFTSSDERRRFGRTLEGMTHLERGRALLTAAQAAEHGSEESQSANVAFKAACVAFEEALDPAFTGGTPVSNKNAHIWARALSAHGATVADLSAAEQSSLLAAFMHALALHWQEGIEAQDLEASPQTATEAALQSAHEFADLRTDLGRSVEALALRFAEGLELKRAGQAGRAVEAFRDVLSTSLAGSTPNTRQRADGIKQAAVLALVQLHLSAGKIQEAQQDAEEFWLLYPLDTNPAARELNGSLPKEQDD